MVDPGAIVQQLNRAGVEYVIIGGVAATLHGCPEQTLDLDINLCAYTSESIAIADRFGSDRRGMGPAFE